MRVAELGGEGEGGASIYTREAPAATDAARICT